MSISPAEPRTGFVPRIAAPLQARTQGGCSEDLGRHLAWCNGFGGAGLCLAYDLRLTQEQGRANGDNHRHGERRGTNGN